VVRLQHVAAAGLIFAIALSGNKKGKEQRILLTKGKEHKGSLAQWGTLTSYAIPEGIGTDFVKKWVLVGGGGGGGGVWFPVETL